MNNIQIAFQRITGYIDFETSDFAFEGWEEIKTVKDLDYYLDDTGELYDRLTKFHRESLLRGLNKCKNATSVAVYGQVLDSLCTIDLTLTENREWKAEFCGGAVLIIGGDTHEDRLIYACKCFELDPDTTEYRIC